MLTLTAAAALQSLLTFSIEGEGPVRFGVPVPTAAVARGLRLGPPGTDARLQWSVLLPQADPYTDRVWIEVMVDGGGGRHELRAVAGGIGPTPPDAAGPVCAVVHARPEGTVESESREWRWASGALDRWERVPAEGARGCFVTQVSGDWMGRVTRVVIGETFWRAGDVEVLPPDRGVARDLRAELLRCVSDLRDAPGDEGRGDYLRGDPDAPTVTNLEFDTALGFARLALTAPAQRDALLRRARAAAVHLLDRDLDVRSGLPHCHGRGHRTAAPEAGHVWIEGLLLTGLLTADRSMIHGAISLGRALARHVEGGRRVRFGRDVGSPLAELETLIRVADSPAVRAACDHLGQELVQRWDGLSGVLRFEEGEGGGATYKERVWQTAGVTVPALRAFVRRTGSKDGQEILRQTERRLLALLRAGRPGIPLSYRVSEVGEVFSVHRAESGAATVFTLAGLSPDNLRRMLQRRSVQRSVDAALEPGSRDLATDFSMVARCRWVYR